MLLQNDTKIIKLSVCFRSDETYRTGGRRSIGLGELYRPMACWEFILNHLPVMYSHAFYEFSAIIVCKWPVSGP